MIHLSYLCVLMYLPLLRYQLDFFFCFHCGLLQPKNMVLHFNWTPWNLSRFEWVVSLVIS